MSKLDIRPNKFVSNETESETLKADIDFERSLIFVDMAKTHGKELVKLQSYYQLLIKLVELYFLNISIIDPKLNYFYTNAAKTVETYFWHISIFFEKYEAADLPLDFNSIHNFKENFYIPFSNMYLAKSELSLCSENIQNNFEVVMENMHRFFGEICRIVSLCDLDLDLYKDITIDEINRYIQLIKTNNNYNIAQDVLTEEVLLFILPTKDKRLRKVRKILKLLTSNKFVSAFSIVQCIKSNISRNSYVYKKHKAQINNRLKTLKKYLKPKRYFIKAVNLPEKGYELVKK